MGHEDAVYLAKLAEQAERYEGMYSSRLCDCTRACSNLDCVPSQKWLTT